MTTRWRWLVWGGYACLWTAGLLYPVPPNTGMESLDEFISPNRYLIAKSVHVTAYAVLTMLTGWLPVPPRWRTLLMFFVLAHGTATELGQYAMLESHWSTRTGDLRDVGFDNLGVLLGLLLSWKWWMRREENQSGSRGP